MWQLALYTPHARNLRIQGMSNRLSSPCDHSLGSLMKSHERLLLAVLMETPTLYLHEMCKHILDTTEVVVLESTICRLLRRHGFTRKKIRHVALQCSTELRALFMAQAPSFPREFFVWVDETGSDARTYMRKFGFSLGGMRAECHYIILSYVLLTLMYGSQWGSLPAAHSL